MYATIYDAVKDLFGWDIPFLKLLQSFGFFVAISFLLCAYFFARELKRKEEGGLLNATFRKAVIGAKASQSELIGQFIIGFMLGWKLLGLFFASPEDGADPRAFILSSRGNILLGLLVGAAFAYYKYYTSKKAALPEPKEVDEKVSPADHVGNMTLIAAAAGFLGAKIFHILENFGDFLEDPGDMFFSFSGLTMYGGLILGSVAVLYYAHRQKFNILHVMDACAPGLFLAYGVGRLGCHISGDGDWGIVNTAPKPGWLGWAPEWFWKYDYPNNVNNTCNPNDNDPAYDMVNLFCDPVRLVDPVFPTPLYEALACILLFGTFWMLRKRFITPGLLFATYMMFNGLERFLVELIRVNTTLFHLGSFRVTQAEFIAFMLIVCGAAFFWWTKNRQKKATA
jgi:phosphatidylglycerol:prolipoprotein diacylglycerol transferase